MKKYIILIIYKIKININSDLETHFTQMLIFYTIFKIKQDSLNTQSVYILIQSLNNNRMNNPSSINNSPYFKLEYTMTKTLKKIRKFYSNAFLRCKASSWLSSKR